jgi:ATP-dependent helicase/nuclease subunit A
MNEISDLKQREFALNPHKSFIVQAPAGSGKTELLTQRFLVLLANTKHAPEEIVAITFTRKAATEMRARILEALNFAAKNLSPELPHALKTWKLAKKVLERDQCAGWKLLQNPNRLRILTIDALCAKIVKSAPLLSHFGSVPQVTEDANEYYREASQALLASLDEAQPWTNSLANILLHIDNNYLAVENLFVHMLASRDQWLSYVINCKDTEKLHKILERGLQNIILTTIEKTFTLMTNENKNELTALARFAADNLMRQKIHDSAIIHCHNLIKFPEIKLPDLPLWLGIAELLLTKSFGWRKSITKNIGFPAPSRAKNCEEEFCLKKMKKRMLNMLQYLASNEPLRAHLQGILQLPPPHYTKDQWEVIKALIEVLPILVAHLTIIFRDKGAVDFIEIAQRAIMALGDSDEPSDLALNLDYQIQHLLVDEFQDTSITQYRLLELLIAGWQPEDGRTLFLVGDPMQSIYRFREAEVGIFLRVKKYGINSIKPESLTLEVNFRSQESIVNWSNQIYSTIFPTNEDIDYGAIPFSRSLGMTENIGRKKTVSFHPLTNPKESHEAKLILSIILNELKHNPTATIAILVRSRTHLQRTLHILKMTKIQFQAIEIEKLKYCSVVQDLFALTRALLHLGDRIAWLTILRAPWCGLTLNDLHALGGKEHATIWESLLQYKTNDKISMDGKQRLQRIIPFITSAIADRNRGNLRQRISLVWYQLGGPACVEEEHKLENAHAYLQLLEKIEENGDLIDLSLLEKKLNKLYSSPRSSHNQVSVHIMTIHKAKGLEFDVVILPSLEKKPAIDKNRLLMWLERQREQNSSDLILAPIKSQSEDDPIYSYLRLQDDIKSRHETIRLLYVATTRAKQSLHLIASTRYDVQKNVFNNPATGSFLEFLWPQLQSEFNNQATHQDSLNEQHKQLNIPNQVLRRLAVDWKFHTTVFQPHENIATDSKYKFDWNPEYQQHIGSVIHQTLQEITQQGLELWDEQKIVKKKIFWRKKMLQLGVNIAVVDDCMIVVEKAINNTLLDQRGRWILTNAHSDNHSEYPLTAIINDEILHFVVDRTFIDDQGYRWIIDYKSSELPPHTEVADFLNHMKGKYEQQLHSYGQVFHVLENRPIRLGIYFPLFSGWSEWDFKC